MTLMLQILAVDISDQAAAWARLNVERLGVQSSVEVQSLSVTLWCTCLWYWQSMSVTVQCCVTSGDCRRLVQCLARPAREAGWRAQQPPLHCKQSAFRIAGAAISSCFCTELLYCILPYLVPLISSATIPIHRQRSPGMSHGLRWMGVRVRARRSSCASAMELPICWRPEAFLRWKLVVSTSNWPVHARKCRQPSLLMYNHTS